MPISIEPAPCKAKLAFLALRGDGLFDSGKKFEELGIWERPRLNLIGCLACVFEVPALPTLDDRAIEGHKSSRGFIHRLQVFGKGNTLRDRTQSLEGSHGAERSASGIVKLHEQIKAPEFLSYPYEPGRFLNEHSNLQIPGMDFVDDAVLAPAQGDHLAHLFHLDSPAALTQLPSRWAALS